MTLHARTRGPAVAAALVAVLVLTVTPATAHPYVQGGSAPARTLTTISLAMAHGCGDESAGGGDPTIEVSLEVPQAMRVVDVADASAYEHTFERADDGRVDAVTWEATDDGEPAPTFDLDVVIDGEEGDEIHLRVFQACDGFVYRWVGTPDEPADDPAIRVTLTEPDPDSPPPPPGEPVPAEQPEDAEDATEDGEVTDPPELDDPAEPDEADEPADDEPAEDDTDPIAADDTGDDGDFPPWAVLLIVVAVVAALGLTLALRSRARRPTGEDPADGPAGHRTGSA